MICIQNWEHLQYIATVLIYQCHILVFRNFFLLHYLCKDGIYKDNLIIFYYLKLTAHCHQGHIRSIIFIATIAQIVVVSVNCLLLFKRNIIRRIGNEFGIARRRRYSSAVRIGPKRADIAFISWFGRIHLIRTARVVLHAAQEIAAIVNCTKGRSHAIFSVHLTASIIRVPSVAQDAAGHGALAIATICKSLYGRVSSVRTSS